MVTYDPITNTICLNRCDCDPCSSVQSCPNCSTQPPCPIPVSIDAEDLQGNTQYFNATPNGIDPFPSIPFNATGFSGLFVEIVYGANILEQMFFTYTGTTQAQVAANIETAIEVWLATTIGGGAWTVTTGFTTTPQGQAIEITNVTGEASPLELEEIQFFEAQNVAVSIHEFDNTIYQNGCVTDVANSQLFTTNGGEHYPGAECSWTHTQTLANCVISSEVFITSAIEQYITVQDLQGNFIGSATYVSGSCGPFECDSRYRLSRQAFVNGTNPGGGDLFEWPLYSTFNIGSLLPVNACPPDPPAGVTTTQCWISSPTATPALPNDIPGSFRFDLVTDAGSYSTVITYTGTDCTLAGQELGTGLENWMAATIGGTWDATIAVLGSIAPFCDVRVDNLVGDGATEQVVSLQITRDSSDGASVTFDSWNNTLTSCPDTSVCYSSSPDPASTPSLANDISGSYRLNVTTSRTTYSNLFPYTGADCTLAQTELRDGIETWLANQLGGVWNVTVSILNGNVAPLCDVRIDNITGSGHSEQINNIEIIRESSDGASSSFTGWTNTVIPCDNGGGGEPPDETECNGETLTAVLQCEANPANPCLVEVNVGADTSGPCTSVDSETLVAKGATSTQTIPLPLVGTHIDLSAFAGETVTLCYDAVFTCGPDTLTETRECTTNIPNFTAEITVNPAQAQAGNNYQTLTDGIAALPDGGRLTITPGTYTVGVPGGAEANRADFSNKRNVCVTSPGIATINGNFADTTPNLNEFGQDRLIGDGDAPVDATMRTNNAVNSLFENIRVEDARRWGIQDQNSNGVVFNNVHVDRVNRTLTGTTVQNGIGIYVIGSQGTQILNSEISNTPTGPGINVLANASNILLQNVNSHHNGDGFLQKNNTGTRVYDSTFANNTRQGILSGDGSVDSLFQNCDVFGNESAGIQLETGGGTSPVRQQVVRGCRVYENNRYTFSFSRGFWTGGESGIWVDDTVEFLIDDCEIYRNHSGIRIATNLAGVTTGQVLDGIVRGNRIFQNNANVSRGGTDPNDLSEGVRPAGNAESLAIRHSRNIRFYHNTFDDNGVNANTVAGLPNGIVTRPVHTGTGVDSSGNTVTGIVNANLSWVNNIVSRTRSNTGSEQAKVLAWSLAGAEFDRMDGNIYYMPSSGSQYLLAGSASFRHGWNPLPGDNTDPSLTFTDYTFAQYQSVILAAQGHEANSVEANPLLDASLTPAASSPAIGNAVPLTIVTATSGTVVGLDEPGVYWPGDIVEFADGSTATVVTVNAANVVLDQAVPASVSAGQGVTLFNCNGSDDIGAVQV